jgi:uncharacterized protein YjiS (DUF1127 family)
MSRLNEMNQALRRQYPRSQWLFELAAPTIALGRGLPRNDREAKPSAANANHPVIGLLESLIRTVVRAVKRRHTASQLKQLDTHLLDDIGIARDEIDEIATEAADKVIAQQGIYTMPRFALLTALRRAWRRQAAIATLQRLSDHTLSDIGIERRRIAASIDALMAQDAVKPAPSQAVRAAKPAVAKPVVDVVPAHQVAA